MEEFMERIFSTPGWIIWGRLWTEIKHGALRVVSVSCIRGLNEDCSPGHSLSGCSEKFFRGSEQGAQHTRVILEKDTSNGTRISVEATAPQEKQTSQLMNLVLFQVWEDMRTWVHKIFSMKTSVTN